jgi:hypothetical protein
MVVQVQRTDRMMAAVLPAARARAMDVDRAGPAGLVKRAMRTVQVAKTQQARAQRAGRAAQTVQAVRVPVRNPRRVPEATMPAEPMAPIARTQQAGAPAARTPEASVVRIPALEVRTPAEPIATVRVSEWAPAKAMPTTESLRSKCPIAM